MEIAKRDIVALFDDSPQRIYRRNDLAKILSDQREFWRLAQAETVASFVEFLLAETKLQLAKLPFPARTETRYTWGDVPFYELLFAMKPGAYFSHYSAMYFHELTDQVPKTIYLNLEQSPKPQPPGELVQERIDVAFRRPPRVSTNCAEFHGHRVYLLSGKNTGRLGVIDVTAPDSSAVEATSIERTLIDGAVRPSYAGGVFEVLKAYRAAHGRISVNRLAATLTKLGYVYPYHQVIGFYLDRTGLFDASKLKPLRKQPIRFDFYLTHAMKDTDYSAEWRLYFPKGL